ncbi:ESX secretion-associated protein EspG [Nocardia carnea]|uniref:ESX secretion-associated protein EspG n=1 Tax=Nocardia carnea TaxID=37328 RepID=A0ABW7TNF5_9NOCA|nr:ESX secretion-associated protein EspG [Nocardia carnea]
MTALTNDALLAVAERLGVQTLPLVLAAGPQQDSYEQWQAARARAVAELTTAGVFDAEGDVDPDTGQALFVLAQPDRELVARGFAEDRILRLCLARRGELHALAVREGDSFEVATIWCDGSAEALARPLITALGPAEAAEVAGFSAPADELAGRLDIAENTGDFADAIYALGVEDRDATVLAAAFASCRGFTEIVAYSHEDGLSMRVPGAVAVYDTDRGRLAVAPTVSPDRQIWSTVTTGSDHRVTQAIATLLEGLPGGRWLTP